MIQLKANTNTPNSGFQLGSQDAGCCIDTLTACLYKFVFGTTPTAFTTVTIAGTAYTFDHTYSTPEALYNALVEVLTLPTTQGGAGLAIHDGDINIYLDSFATTADSLTIEMISGVAIDSFTTNVGVEDGEEAVCTKQTMCVHKLTYELGAAIALVIDNKLLTLATYATAALLRTAVVAQITAEGLDGTAKAVVRTSETAGFADLWIYAVPGTKIYHDGVLIAKGKCSAHYV